VSLQYKLPSHIMGWWEGMASIVDMRCSVTGTPKYTGQRLLTTHAVMHTYFGLVPVHTYTLVWFWVEQWAYWRPQLMAAKYQIFQQPTTATTMSNKLFSSKIRHRTLFLVGHDVENWVYRFTCMHKNAISKPLFVSFCHSNPLCHLWFIHGNWHCINSVSVLFFSQR